MNNQLLNELSIPEISSEKNYWMIRTNGGEYYQDFTLGHYVAIGWDYITVDLFFSTPADVVKETISEKQGNKNSSAGKRSSALAYHKLYRFISEIQVGDIILLPSTSSKRITIAEITSDVYEEIGYVDRYLLESPDTEVNPCPHQKRRKIKSLITVPREKVDIFLSQSFSSHHAISNLNAYSHYINRTIYPIYTTGDSLHNTIHAGHPNGIKLEDLIQLLTYYNKSIIDIAKQCGTKVDKNDIEVKLNIHSPGLIEIISTGAQTALPFVIFFLLTNNIISGGGIDIDIPLPNGQRFSIKSNTPGILGRINENTALNNQETESQRRHEERMAELSLENRSLDIEERRLEVEAQRLDYNFYIDDKLLDIKEKEMYTELVEKLAIKTVDYDLEKEKTFLNDSDDE